MISKYKSAVACASNESVNFFIILFVVFAFIFKYTMQL